jgi:hypothetical protein
MVAGQVVNGDWDVVEVGKQYVCFHFQPPIRLWVVLQSSGVAMFALETRLFTE